MIDDNQQITKDFIEDAVISALGRGAADGRYIDVGRIPFICDDIRGMHLSLDEINTELKGMRKLLESFPLIRMLVFGSVGAILLGFVGLVGNIIMTYLNTSHL